MKTVNVADLKPYKDNPRNISESAYKRLKEQLKLGQHTTLLVTPDNVVLSGNMRLKAMQELGIQTALVIVLGHEELDGVIYPKLDGQVVHKTFQSVDDMYMSYALSANDSAGHYDQDMLINLMDNFQIDWDAFAISFKEDETIKRQLEKLAHSFDTEDEEDEKPPEITCPHCGKSFKPTE